MTDSAESSPAPAVPWHVVGAVIAAMSVFTLTLGLTYPLLALILENKATPKALIGLNAAMTPLGIIVSAPVIPRFTGARGGWGLAMTCLAATLMIFVLIGATRRIEVWFVLRFLLGICTNGLFIVSETWINQLADTHTRGRIMGLYATVMSLGFCVGPFVLPLTGFDGWPPFMVGIVSVAAAGVIMLPLRRRIPGIEKTAHASMYGFVRLAPALLLAVLSAAHFDQVALSFLPLYALYYGLSQGTASFALGILIVGNVFMQIPMGWLADRTSRRLVMLACTGATLAGCAFLPLVMRNTWLLWPLLFIWGGAAFGVYTIALAQLGDRYRGAMLLTGNAAFGLMWGLGGIVGPTSMGAVMQLWGPSVFPLFLGLPFALFAGLLLWRRPPAQNKISGAGRIRSKRENGR